MDDNRVLKTKCAGDISLKSFLVMVRANGGPAAVWDEIVAALKDVAELDAVQKQAETHNTPDTGSYEINRDPKTGIETVGRYIPAPRVGDVWTIKRFLTNEQEKDPDQHGVIAVILRAVGHLSVRVEHTTLGQTRWYSMDDWNAMKIEYVGYIRPAGWFRDEEIVYGPRPLWMIED